MNSESIEIKAAQRPRPRKANECIIDPKRFFLPAPLFDEFWRDGELALLFGPTGVGKSVLAVQVADALARGRPLDGFRMPTGRRKVLYVDLEHSDTQFQARYSQIPPNMWPLKSYKFAENLYRDRPPGGDDLCEWLRETVLEDGVQVVIIDDLSAVKRTHDGIRETLTLMRRLKQLRDELRLSILVLANSEPPARSGIVSEHDLRRSSVLCSAADSVFAIGRHPQRVDDRYLIQMRSRSASIFWTAQNAPVGNVTRLDTGMLGFVFDERFAPRMDDETRRLICRVRSKHDRGKTYRAIANELVISKSQVARLYKKWTPALDCGLRTADCGFDGKDRPGDESEPGAVATGFRDPLSDEPEEWEEDEIDQPAWLEGDEEMSIGKENHPVGETPPPLLRKEGSFYADEMDVEVIPCAAGPAPASVYDLKTGLDGYGREIFIEIEDEHTGKPMVWYQFNEKGNKVRFERKPSGVITERLSSSQYL